MHKSTIPFLIIVIFRNKYDLHDTTFVENTKQ